MNGARRVSVVLSVRRAEPREWRVAREIRLRALADAPSAFGSTWARERCFEDEMWQRRVSEGAWFLAWLDRQAVGVAAVIPVPGDERARELVGLWVQPDVRGLKVADRLVTAVCQHEVRDRAAALSLWVVTTNQRARRFYERVGFRPTGDVQPVPDAPDRQEAHMTKLLSPPYGAL